MVNMNTTPNSEEAVRKAALLRKARIIVAKKSHRFGICSALVEAADNTRRANRQKAYYDADTLGIYISKALGNHCYLNSWLRSNRGMCGRFEDKPNNDETRPARLMWIDWMIASLEGREYIPTK